MDKNNKQRWPIKMCRHIATTFVFTIFTLTFSVLSSASILDATITTGKGETRIIDLSNNVTNIAQPSLTIATQPANGSAESIICGRTGKNLCVSYSPNSTYSGIDTFTISVINDNDQTETATITVNVANVSIAGNGVIPNNVIRGTLDKICGNLQTTDVDILCQGFNNVNATAGELPEDLRELLNALTPQDIAAQGATSNVLAAQQLENIGKHLAALRRGQKNVSLNGFSFRYKKRNIPITLLSPEFFNASEGDAQKTFGINWGWFINGSLGGGKQKATTFENGFDYSTNGLSMGADYRLGNIGIVGFALGYGNTQLDVSLDQGGLDAKGYSTVLYASLYASEKLYLDVIGSSNQYQFDSSRRILFGQIDAFSTSRNKSNATALNITAGYELFHYSGLTANISASGEYMESLIDGYTEQGNSPFNVTITDRTIKRYAATVGGSLAYAMSFSKAVLLPQLDVFAIKQVERGGETIEGYFNADPDKTPFRFNTNSRDERYLSVKAGVSAVFTGGHSAFIQVGTTLLYGNYQNWNTSIGYRTEL